MTKRQALNLNETQIVRHAPEIHMLHNVTLDANSEMTDLYKYTCSWLNRVCMSLGPCVAHAILVRNEIINSLALQE